MLFSIILKKFWKTFVSLSGMLCLKKKNETHTEDLFPPSKNKACNKYCDNLCTYTL